MSCILRVFVVFVFVLISIASAANTRGDFNVEKVKLGKNLVLPQLGCVKQDSLGFIWFSSGFSLYRYDGKSLKEFKMDYPINKIPYEEKTINDFVFDSLGNIWLATARGLVCFLVEEEQYCLFEKSGLHLSDFSMKVLSVEELEPGKIIFNSTDGLYVFSFRSEKDLIAGEGLSLHRLQNVPGGNIYIVEKVKSGTIWLGGDQGVCMLSKDGKFSEVIEWPEEKQCKITPSSFLEDQGGILWIATRGDGVWKMKLSQGTLKNVVNHGGNDVLSNIVYQICGNEKGIFYATLNGVGQLDRADIETKNGGIEDYTQKIKVLLQGKMMIAIFSDQSGVVWSGSILNGLYKINYQSIFYEYIQPKRALNLVPYFNNVSTIAIDSNDNVWNFEKGYFRKREKGKLNRPVKVEFEGGLLSCRYFKIIDNQLFVAKNRGLEIFDLETLMPVESPELDYLKSFSRKRTYIEFIKDASGNYWFLDKSGELILIYKDKSGRYLSKLILSQEKTYIESSIILFPASDGKVWVSMLHSGLYYYDPELGELKKHKIYDHKIGEQEFYVSCIMEDRKNEIWFGTHNGILRLNPLDFKQEWIKASEQLMVYSLEEDEVGNMWGASHSHFFRFNKETGIIDEFEPKGFTGEFGFFPELVQKYSDGSLLYPLTNSGFFHIKPEMIPVKQPIPDVAIFEIRVHNIELKKDKPIYGQNLLDKDVAYLKKIKLKYYQRNLSFGFVGLDYKNQDKIIYEYRLDGVDAEWVSSNARNRFVNYSNLKPGKYKFQVRASYDGNFAESKITSLDINITQAWYKTPIAYLVYILVLIVAVYYIWRYTLERVRLKEQLKLERFQSKKEKELNQAKLEFFTNVSHEFKTPLSLLIGPLNKLIRSNVEEAEREKLYSLMYRNADRLLRLINQIMDFRKVSKGSLKLKVIHDNLSFYVHNVFNYFIDVAEQKNIDFDLRCDKELSVWFDADIIEKVLSNLIFNALKYTEPEGNVVVEVVRLEKEIQIIIEDSGIGIKEEHLEHIFDRFYRAENKKSTGSEAGGTGIGLALTKQLVELHKGRIEVESQEGKGSRFIVYIGCEKEFFSNDELIMEKITALAQDSVEYQPLSKSEDLYQELDEIKATGINTPKAKLLIVEDDYDLRKFLKEFFKSNYKVYEAENGEKGLMLALEKAPDIIISDVMMPVMDGLEFCRKVKEDMAISHLPVVLLTARSKVEHQIEGLETGADAYVAKPFDPNYLEVVIRRLIETRKHLREKFDRKFVELTTDELKLTNADQHFLDKVIKIIEDNISNTDFRMEDVYTQLGLGRTHFHNKMKAITNQTGGDFIRTVRLKRAAFLLKNHNIRVSDVCYDVGFTDPKYFGKVFRKYFGVSPREYSKNNNRDKSDL